MPTGRTPLGVMEAPEGGYPYWSAPTENDIGGSGGHMTLYWSKGVEIASVISGKPGSYTIHCADAKGINWTCTVVSEVGSIEEAQKVAEVIMRFIQLGA